MFQPVISYWCNTPKTLNSSSNKVFLVSAYPIYDTRLLDLLRFKKYVFFGMELRLLINVIKVTTVQKKTYNGQEQQQQKYYSSHRSKQSSAKSQSPLQELEVSPHKSNKKLKGTLPGTEIKSIYLVY